MGILVWWLVAASVLAGETSSAPATNTLPPPKHVLVPKLSGPIQIDGELSEPVWSKAAILTPFFLNNGSGREREQTELRIWYDDQALYLGWMCSDVDIQATFTNRDSRFWEEEVVEFFVTRTNLSRYFELQWNPLGGVFDAIIQNELDTNGVSRNFTGDWSFTVKHMASAVKVKGTTNLSSDKDKFWRVEVRLPFADLDQPTPRPKDVWRANFFRFNRTQGLPVEELSWSPAIWPGFHQPSRFGLLEFN